MKLILFTVLKENGRIIMSKKIGFNPSDTLGIVIHSVFKDYAKLPDFELDNTSTKLKCEGIDINDALNFSLNDINDKKNPIFEEGISIKLASIYLKACNTR